MIKVAIVDDDAIVAMSMQTILGAASDMEGLGPMMAEMP